MKKLFNTILFLLLTVLLMGQWYIDEDFENISELPTGWSVADEDDDGMTWRILEHENAHGGNQAIFVDNYLPNQNEDWLMTPQLSVIEGDVLKLYCRSWFSTESLQIYVSTSGNDVNDFDDLLLETQDIGSSYEYLTVSLDSYANMDIYLGFLWECENYAILIDDIMIGQEPIIDPELNLPNEISFYISEGYDMDFTEYIEATDINNVTLTASENDSVVVTIDGINVNFSAIDFVGSQEIVFTLTDNITDETAVDTLIVNVLADPVADLYIDEIVSPQAIEYLNNPIIPEIVVGNSGTADFNNNIELSLNVFNTQDELIYTDQLVRTILLLPSNTEIIDFDDSFIPETEEEMRFVYEITTTDDNFANNTLETVSTILMRVTTAGPDSFGYHFADSNDLQGPSYEWIDISETGESTIMYNVSTWSGDDNFSEPIPLGFDFPFYGTSYNNAYVDINGELLLAPNNWYDEYPTNGWDTDGNVFNYMYSIPGYSQMPALIAVYWDDLEAEQGTGDVYFESFGTAPNRYTIIQWDNLSFQAGTNPSNLLKFQVILFENGEIKMQYHTVATGQTGANIPHDFGQSATIGIQNELANIGISYLHELVDNNTYLGVEPAGNILHDELSILFYCGDDMQAPVITHDSLKNTFNQYVTAEFNIIDMSLPLYPILYYNSGSGWQEQDICTNEGQNFSFELQDFPLGSTVNYYLEVEDAQGNSATLPENAPEESYSFNILPTENSLILLAYSGIQDWTGEELNAYEEVLDELDIDYDLWDWQSDENYTIPSQYQGIIAYANTGSANEQMQFFANALTNYLDQGTELHPKNIWFASDGLASNQHAHPDSSSIRRMMSGYFRIHFVAQGFGGGNNGLGGPDSYEFNYGTIKALPESQIGTADSEYDVYANGPDCIFPNDSAGNVYYDEVPYPEIGAEAIYVFEDGPINGQAYLYHGVSATTVTTPSYRSMYFSFDFTQLTNIADRLEWMSDLMDWWQIGEVNNNENVAPAIKSSLDNIYPNPFNPNTNIMFSLKSQENVILTIYNIKGQKVKSLLNETKLAGTHNINWDGTNDLGKTVSSGIYFVKMKTQDCEQIRKLTLMK